MSTTLLASALSPFSARLRISIALRQLSIPVETPPGGTGSAELKAVNPFGQIPILMVDGKALVESLALLDYLEDAYPQSRRLRPADPLLAARARSIGLLFDNKVFPALRPMFAQMTGAAPPDVAVVHAALDEAANHLQNLSTFFDAEGPAVGGELSNADCALAPFAWLLGVVAPKFGATSPFTRTPRLVSWWEVVGATPEVEQVINGLKQAFAAFAAKK